MDRMEFIANIKEREEGGKKYLGITLKGETEICGVYEGDVDINWLRNSMYDKALQIFGDKLDEVRVTDG